MERITSSKGGNCGARAFNTKSQRREDIFSELLADPPSDEILAELFPNETDLDRKVVWCHEE